MMIQIDKGTYYHLRSYDGQMIWEHEAWDKAATVRIL